MATGVTASAFARLHGVAKSAVHKWGQRGLLVRLADGTIDVEATDARLTQRPNIYRGGAAKGPAAGSPQLNSEERAPETHGTTLKHYPETAHFVCEAYQERIEERYKPAMIAAGQWIAEKPFNGHAGFKLRADVGLKPFLAAVVAVGDCCYSTLDRLPYDLAVGLTDAFRHVERVDLTSWWRRVLTGKLGTPIALYPQSVVVPPRAMIQTRLGGERVATQFFPPPASDSAHARNFPAIQRP